MIFRVSEIGQKKRKRKKASLFYLSPPPHFLSCCRLCHGKDQATLLRPRVNGQRRTFGVRVRFVRLFFFLLLFSFSLVLLCLERRALVLTTVMFGARFNERNELVY